MRTDPLVLKLAGHLAMGVALGGGLGLSLIACNVRSISGMIANSASPELNYAIFVSVFTLLCGVGATLTGWLFIMVDETDR